MLIIEVLAYVFHAQIITNSSSLITVLSQLCDSYNVGRIFVTLIWVINRYLKIRIGR